MLENRKVLLLIGFVILCLAGGAYALFAEEKPLQQASKMTGCYTNPSLEIKRLEANGVVVQAEIAAKDGDKQLGLSGRDCIGDDAAMLFPYALAGDYCYWMKDMKMPIDMIWLDDEKKIVTVKADVSPDTYPKESFCPERPAQYIVEVRAGKAEASGWSTGTQFAF